MKLLIAKDDEGVRHVVSIAHEAGFQPEEITVTRSADQTMAALAACVPDIAVIDPHLTPWDERKEDGIEVIAAMTELHRGCVVICLTSRGSIPMGQRALRRGARDYVDCDIPYVNWCSFLKHRLELWRSVLIADREEGKTVP